MHRLLCILAAAFFIVLFSAGAFVGYVIHRGNNLNAESKAYVEQAVVDIGQNWDRQELIKRASPDLIANLSPQQIAQLFDPLAARFGKLTRYDGQTGFATITMGAGSKIIAHYDVAATFENGPVGFRIDLVKINDRWMIESFYVHLSLSSTSDNSKNL
jgi:hypothetical protein